jgi:glycosyltransferase involved in cell wall biosynthesis
MKISVVFPALNESAVIERTLDNALMHLHKLGEPFEVIVVDNASSDNTVALVEEISRTHPEVRVIRHITNLGYGNSNLTGFRNAVGDVVAVADSDGQHTLADLPLFLEKIKAGAHVVYGWRRERHDPRFRKIVSAGLHDINCGFRVVTAPVAQSMKSVHPVNYFGPELWVHSVRNRFKVEEVVVQHSERAGGASIHIPWRLPIIVARAFRYLFALKGELNA